MKYRKHLWLDTKLMIPKYGIQAKRPTDRKYLHVFEDKKPLILDSEEECDIKLQTLKKTSD